MRIGLKIASRTRRHRAKLGASQLLAPLWTPMFLLSGTLTWTRALWAVDPTPHHGKALWVADLEAEPTQYSQGTLSRSCRWGALDKSLSSPSCHPLGFEKEISEGPLVLMSNHLCGSPTGCHLCQ